MKQAIWAAAFAVAGAGMATAQEDHDRKVEELKRQFDRSLKALQEKFEQEKGRLEKDFKAAMERLKAPGKAEPRKGEGEKGKPNLERLVERLIDRVDRLEKKLEGWGGLYRRFDFKKLEDWGEFLPPRVREFMEKRKGEKDFRFEFRVPPGRKKDDSKPEEKHKKKDKGKDEDDSF